MSYRIWENLPGKFKLGEDPEQPVTLWRGDKIGREVTGMRCHFGGYEASEEAVYESIFVKYPHLRTVVKRHVKDSFDTPFVSLARDIRVAQDFADPASGLDEQDTTVYEITVPAYRLVAVPLGGKKYFPGEQSEEVLAIGAVEPTEITAVKRNNVELATDLLDASTGDPLDLSGYLTRNAAFNALQDTAIRPLNSQGEWDRSMSWVA